jgi:hypothetical protein
VGRRIERKGTGSGCSGRTIVEGHAVDTGKDSQAERNRQGLANRMSLDEVKRAMALTDQLLKPNQLKPGLQAYWRRQE